MMNRFCLLPLAILVLALGWPAASQAGVTFLPISLEEARAKAQQENKLIFVDVYATWCGACNKLDKQVFAREDVGKVMNAHFLPLKIDGESKAGKAFRQNHELDAYPSLFVLNARGELAYKAVGYRSPEQLLALLKRVQDPANHLPNLRSRYEAAADPPAELLRNYYRALYDANQSDDAAKVYAGFMETVEQADWLTPANAELVFSRLESTTERKFGYLVRHREAFLAHNSPGQYRRFVMRAAWKDFEAIATNEDERGLRELTERVRGAFPNENAYLADYIELTYAKRTGDPERYRNTADRLGSEAVNDPAILNEIAWHYYQTVDDREALEQALRWTEEAIEMERRYAYLDTRAALLFKLGQTKAGRRAAEEALDQAKQEGADWSGTFDLIEEWTQ